MRKLQIFGENVYLFILCQFVISFKNVISKETTATSYKIVTDVATGSRRFEHI